MRFSRYVINRLVSLADEGAESRDLEPRPTMRIRGSRGTTGAT
jgi:hypothetical protein